MAGKSFQVWAAVDSWHDGDTFFGVVDQGYGEFRARRLILPDGGPPQLVPMRVRCALIDAPELKVNGQPNPAGADALAYAVVLAPRGLYPCVTYRATEASEDSDNFGRPLIDLILPDGRRFSEAMLNAGHAVPYRA